MDVVKEELTASVSRWWIVRRLRQSYLIRAGGRVAWNAATPGGAKLESHTGRMSERTRDPCGEAVPPWGATELLRTSAAVAADAGAGFVEGRGNRATQEDSRQCNRRTDDRENEGVLGSRSAGLVPQQVDESLH